MFCTAVAFAILYAPQPLLPLLAQHWGRELPEVALLTTTTMTPLALAPLVYGYVLEHVSTRRMLVAGLAVLCMAQFALSTGPDYPVFLALRTVEGLVLPAIFTALMTYSSAAGGHGAARRNITVYIAATIFGGFCGRALTGLVTDLFHWQAAFWLWSGMAALALLATRWLASDPRPRLGKVHLHEIRALLRRPIYREGLASAFILFFVFAAMLNFLPFRMREIDPGVSQSTIALVYVGYLIGVVISLSSLRMIRLFGSEQRTLVAGSLVYVAGTLSFAIPHIGVVYAAMFVFAAGMFTLHSVLSAYLNHLESERKGLVNGLYVSAYYSGGALGSFAPGLLYQGWGWQPFTLALTLLSAALIAISLVLPPEGGVREGRRR